MPITRVLDRQGNVIHDCAAAGCSVSWDGYGLPGGELIDGRTDPGPEWVQVDDSTVRLAAPAEDGAPPAGSIPQG